MNYDRPWKGFSDPKLDNWGNPAIVSKKSEPGSSKFQKMSDSQSHIADETTAYTLSVFCTAGLKHFKAQRDHPRPIDRFPDAEDPLDLAVATVIYLRPSELTDIQQQGKAEFEDWWKAHLHRPFNVTVDRWSARSLFSLLRAFSKMFLLKEFPAPHIRVELSWVKDLISNKGAYGLTSHDQDPRTGDSVITIKRDPITDQEIRADTNLPGHLSRVCSVLRR
jgi:hypothetical protein